MIGIQKYIRAQSLEEAYQLNQSRANRVMGGMLWLKTGKGNVNTVIDLCGLGLDGIEETEEAFVIGAMTSLREIELHRGLNQYTQGGRGGGPGYCGGAVPEPGHGGRQYLGAVRLFRCADLFSVPGDFCGIVQGRRDSPGTVCRHGI